MPELRLVEIGWVSGIFQHDSTVVREEREVLQRLWTKSLVLVTVNNHRGYLYM